MLPELSVAAAAMELGQVLGFAAPSHKESDLGLAKRSGFAQAAASYPSPFLDEQKMLSFSKAANALPPAIDFGRANEQRFLLSKNKMLFTPTQWMELEHQALIYKYLNAKAPIPSSLLISISNSFRSSSDRLTWRPVYQGFTNADTDPEPGRCRRTDGKKWRCSKEAMADHKYCDRHINRNRHRSRKPVENQTRKTAKETPAAGSLSAPASQGSSKKAKATNELLPASDSYWTDSLNRTMVMNERANKPEQGNNAAQLNSTNRQHTLPLLSQLKKQNKPDEFSPTVDSESISSNTVLKPWDRSNRQLHDREYLQSVLQNFSLHKNDKIESQKIKASNPMPVSSAFYLSPEGQHISCLTSNMTQWQEDCISGSWEMPQGGPLGEILTNSKNTEDFTNKCGSRPYGW